MSYLGREAAKAPLVTSDIPTDSINSDHYVDASIDTAHIGDDQVTADKLANSINTDIATGPAALPKAGGDMTGALNIATSDASITPNADANELVVESNGASGITIGSSTSTPGSIRFADSGGDSQGMLYYEHNHDQMRFYTGGSERMRIDSSGYIGANTNSGFTAATSSARGIWLKGATPSWGILGIQTNAMSGTVNMIKFQDGDGDDCGEIIADTSANSTSYSTGSDYRLKENVIDMSGSITKLKSLKPKYFNFIKDINKKVFGGFLAHEVSDIVPEAIHGEKDAMRMDEYEVTPAVEEVRDENGNITTEAVEAVIREKEIISQQTIDQSKLVPLLVGALQEAIARIEVLESA